MMEYLKKGGMIWWILVISISIISLLYLILWGYQNNNFKAVVVAVIFIFFILIPFVFEFVKVLIPNDADFSLNSVSFVAGLALSTALGALGGMSTGTFSIFTMRQQYLLSEISPQLPQFWSKFADVWSASVGEELIFLISIPIILFALLDFVGNNSKLNFLKNWWVQMLVVFAIDAPLFVYFHIGNMGLIAFAIAAVIFRVVTLGLVWGDVKANIIPLVVVVPSFAIGFHMANNIMSTGGWLSFFSIMATNPFGWLVIGFILLNIGLTVSWGWFKLRKMRR